MKPEPRRSPGVDPTQNKKLTVKMKSQLKFKSPEILPKTTRKVGLIKQMTSTTYKNSAFSPCSISVPPSKQLLSVSENDISGISPIKNFESHASLHNLTPKIIITKSLRQTKDSKVSPKPKKTVVRSKVKSPVNGTLQRSTGARDQKKSKEASKLVELETQLKKKNSEMLNLNRKVNTLQKTLADKDKVIRDLEIKFPKMLSELKKGFGEDESKKKVNKELKDTIKRNRQLSGAQRHTEDQLKVKDEKLKQAILTRDKALEELKVKEKESKDFLLRLVSLEKSFPELVLKLSEKDCEIRRYKETIGNFEQRLKILTEDNFLKIRSIDQISDQLVDLNNNVLEKESEIVDLKQFNFELQNNLRDEIIKTRRLEQEIRKHLKINDQLCGIKEQPNSGNEGVNFDEATEDFLDKVSAVSRDQNVTVNLKLTVKKSRVSNILDQSGINCGKNRLKTLTAEDSFINRLDDAYEEFPEVFDDEDSTDLAEDMSTEDIDDSTSNIEDSNMSEKEYDVSAGTMARAEELDIKVRELWTRLSTRDETFEDLKNDRLNFTTSVSRLESDLNQSILQHNRFLDQVSVAKKLFH